MPSPSQPVERAKPLLGTIVRMRVAGLAPDRAHEAISGAFGIVSEIHHLMSFHEAGSELSRLNAEAARTPMRISPHTRAVLEKALEMARVSRGLFDPTIAPAMVRSGLLPCPGEDLGENAATWEDIALSSDGSVTFRRPLWLDLGGIAKGYAVDCALAHLEAHHPASAYVEAGGDLRVTGPAPETVYLAARGSVERPVLTIENAAVASSGSQPADDDPDGLPASAHIDTRTGQFCATDRFVSVVAPRCIDADALTKVVMAAGPAAAPVLAGYQACAFLFEGAAWSQVGGTSSCM
jgi:thiamine biosynthesis lipoprotein